MNYELRSKKTNPIQSQLLNPRKSCEIRGLYFGWQKKAKNGAVLDNFGVFLAQFGVIWDKFGVVLDYFGNIKIPRNRIFNTNNAENTKF